MSRWIVNKLTDLWQWTDKRLPVQRAWDTHMAKYYAPKNFNLWYYFGVLSLIVLVIQLLSGIWLLMFYNTSGEDAFASVEYIMRDVPWGSYIRYMHSTGASAFFIVVYLHMFRALLYGSYRAPRELLWIIGMFIYVALMAEAFLGYVLPWGQMSYWGAQVIINLFGALPLGLGEPIIDWIRSDFLISGATLNKFVALHAVAVPLVLIVLVFIHILALHEVGSNNPDGIEIKETKDKEGKPVDGIPFFPYYLPLHDLMPIIIFLAAFTVVMFFFPEMGGFFLEHPNFEPANQYKTPEHIAPVWYFTPFYSILRAMNFDIFFLNAKFLGFVAMASAIIILFLLPWIDKSPVKSIRYKGNLTKVMLLTFVAFFIILGYLGVKAPTPGRVVLAQIGTLFYFGFFVCMPTWSRNQLTLLGQIWCYLYAIGFLLLSVFDLSQLKFYGTTNDLGNVVTHPSIFLLVVCLLLAALFAMLPKLATKQQFKQPPKRVTMQGLGFGSVVKGLAVVAVLVLLPVIAVGAETKYDCGNIPCEPFTIDATDKASLQRGLKWYTHYCAGCHGVQYSRYERVADDLNIPHEIMLDLVVPSNKKIGELMTTNMSSEYGKNVFGNPPPDLSLITRSRSPEWVYTYLLNFYRDDSRPYGVNNRVFPNVGMPHVMLELQGVAECQFGPVKAKNGGLKRDPITRELVLEEPCGILQVDNQGALTEQEFKQAVYDITNFLEYVSDPGKVQRHKHGYYVLLFLAVFFVFAWALNREYWKSIH